MSENHDHDPLQPHAHDPNPEPPSDDPSFVLRQPSGDEQRLTVGDLKRIRPVAVPNCYIVSTGHGTSGPFTFGGAQLLDVIRHYVDGPWSQVEVVSADDFGNRIFREELINPDPGGPILLAFTVDGREMTREQGLVRLIVPSERDDALRQVKWVGEIRVRR